MSSKRILKSMVESDKKRRKVIDLEEKLIIINKYEGGSTKAKIGREHGLNESTVRHIVEHAKQYKKQGQSTSTPAGLQTRNRSNLMIEMESLLSAWIEDYNQKQIPLSQITIKTKALSLFEALKQKRIDDNEEDITEEKFSASSGWFDRFKKRSRIYNIHAKGGRTSADEKHEAKFSDELKQITEEQGYSDKNNCNADETSTSTETYLEKNEGLQPQPSQVSNRFLLEPLDPDVIAALKTYYLCKTFNHAIEKTRGGEKPQTEFCTENLKDPVSEVSASNMRIAGQKLITHCANDFKGFDVEVNDNIKNITQVGLMEMFHSDDEVNEDSFGNLDSKQMFIAQDDKNEADEIEVKIEEFNGKELDEILCICESLKQKIMDSDPNPERSRNVCREIESAVSCYQVMYKEKQNSLNQSNI